MSWIKDIKDELSKLDLSIKSLRKFGLTIGIAFSLLGLWFFLENIFDSARILLILLGLFLFASGTLYPSILIKFYRIWMLFAFTLGWFVSRLLLTFLFVFVLTPIGFIAKLFNKKFLILSLKENKKSYWIKKESDVIDYEKMY